MPAICCDGAPSVATLPRAQMSSDFEKIRRSRLRYQNAWNAKEWEFAQTIDCWKMYFGAIGEQWDEEALRYKTERHQRAAQYNIIRTKVRTMLGMLASDEYDGRFDPITGVRNSGIEAVENAFYCDKELMDYENEYWQVILDGLVHVGTMECRFTMDKNPLHGNITFVRVLPNRWVTDPDWKTNDMRDCFWAWKQGHMSARQLENMGDSLPMTPQFENALRKEKEIGRDWSEPEINEYDSSTPTFLDTYHVIEEHHIEIVKKKRIIARRPDGIWVPFPVTEENEALERFAIENGVTDWQNGARVVPYEDRIAYVDRMCPELFPNKLIGSGKPEIQIKGLPICQFTYDKDISGRNLGMVNDAIDPQRDLNYSKSKRQELLAAAQGGAVIYNRQRIPQEDEQQDFESNHNDPTRSFGIDGDPDGFMDRVSSNTYPSELIRESEEPFNIVDKILGVSAAMSSRTEGSGEPASLFAMKLKVNKVGTLPLDKRIRMLRMWQYQSYFLQAQISYAGDERCFTSPDGSKKAVLNERLPDGSIRNKIDELPLCSVTLSESEGSLTRQLRDRAEIAAMLEAIPDSYREPIALMIGEAFKTMDVSADRKHMIEQAMQVEVAKARLSSMTEIAGLIAQGKGSKAEGLQAEIMGQQLEAQLRQMLQPVMAPQQPQGLPDMVSAPSQGGMGGPAQPGPTSQLTPAPNPMQQIQQTSTPINP